MPATRPEGRRRENWPSNWEELARAFHGRMGMAAYTMDFNASLEALMLNPLLTANERVFAWCKRRAWGNFSDYAVNGINGAPLWQVDCAHELGLDKRIVNNSIRYWKAAGYVRTDGKLIYPEADPVSARTNTEKVTHSSDFCEFLECWKQEHPSEFQALEVARSEVRRIKKVILSDYKKSRASSTKGCNSPTTDTVTRRGINDLPCPPLNSQIERPQIEEKRLSSSSLAFMTTTAPANTPSETVSMSPPPRPHGLCVDTAAEPRAIDYEKIFDVVNQYAICDMEGVQNMVMRCRANDSMVSEDEICQAIHDRAATASTCENPFGYLINYVPKSDFARIRQKLRTGRGHRAGAVNDQRVTSMPPGWQRCQVCGDQTVDPEGHCHSEKCAGTQARAHGS